MGLVMLAGRRPQGRRRWRGVLGERTRRGKRPGGGDGAAVWGAEEMGPRFGGVEEMGWRRWAAFFVVEDGRQVEDAPVMGRGRSRARAVGDTDVGPS